METMGYSLPWGYKYRNLALQVGGAWGKIEKVKHGHEPQGLSPQEDCAGEAQQELKTTNTDILSERAPHINKLVKQLKKEKREIGLGFQDRLADWPSVVMLLWLWVWTYY
jgi:hypothetical protein